MYLQSRWAIDRDIADLRLLADKVAESTRHVDITTDFLAALSVSGSDYREQEKRLDAAAFSLRRKWLELAHLPADATQKSPCSGQSSHLAGGGDVDFGYERDLDVFVLESRSVSYMQHPSGWSTELVLFRSGQAALSVLLHQAISKWGRAAPLSIAHSGAYFETASLLDTWPQRVLRRVSKEAETADLVIVEPVWCDGQFGCSTDTPLARHALLIDTTLSGPAFDPTPYLQKCDLVISYSSGLKLDQAGLELANVGIVQIFSRAEDAAILASDLRAVRGLTATGLTFDELSALSAPWFMDRSYVDTYSAAIFEHNRTLAQSIGVGSSVFDDRCHPSLFSVGADAPFCAIKLRQSSSIQDYRILADVVAREIEARGLLVSRGGSFGFRGHRFELIQPERGSPFLRIALGWRDGHSRQGMCDLFAELAGRTSL